MLMVKRKPTTWGILTQEGEPVEQCFVVSQEGKHERLTSLERKGNESATMSKIIEGGQIMEGTPAETKREG
jgi:hypothetical protein